MNSKHWLIVYDIRDSKRLRKVEKCMESYAWRVQKSVFESYAPETAMELLKSRLEKVMDTTEDFVLFFDVCERDWQKQEKYGIGSRDCERMSDDKFLIL
jgi:CRISPR-associated protein Cas2